MTKCHENSKILLVLYNENSTEDQRLEENYQHETIDHSFTEPMILAERSPSVNESDDLPNQNLTIDNDAEKSTETSESDSPDKNYEVVSSSGTESAKEARKKLLNKKNYETRKTEKRVNELNDLVFIDILKSKAKSDPVVFELSLEKIGYFGLLEIFNDLKKDLSLRKKFVFLNFFS